MRTRTIALALGIMGSGCGARGPSYPAPAAPAARTVPASVAVTGPAKPLATSAIRRSSVQAVLAAGPGAFLQNLAVDDQPVFLQGKFHGFRIAALEGDSWKGVDLRPGDVVTHVNGFSLEHPEEAAEAFYSLRVASELTVEYERDGEPHEIRFGIIDDGPSPGTETTRKN
jgi:type II secretory pathway component PulC